MIRRANERVTEIREQMRGGKGAVEISPLFEKGEYKGKARLIAQITLNPGCSIGDHAHEGEDEIYFFISGKGIVNDNGVIHEVTAGDSVLTGNGAYHSVENTGDEPLVLMAVIILYE
jgi:mannose-6-phosphate isomerase-like protein (cupin superfamily)